MNPLLQLRQFAVASLIAAAPVDDSLLVRVVDDQGRPVAGAWVASGWSRLFEELVEIGSLREWIERGGKGAPHGVEGCVATDAGGVARVRASDPWNDCIAITPTHGARAIVAHGSVGELELRLAPHRWWRVRLVEPDGSPARCTVPITLLTEVDDFAVPPFTQLDSIVPRGGIATFGPLEYLLDPDAVDPELFVRPELPCLSRPRLRCRASQITAEPMALALPPYGSFELRFVEADDSLAHRPVVASVSSDEFSQLDLPGPYFETWSESLRTVDGVAIVEPVGVGLQMRIEIDDPTETDGARSGQLRTRALTAAGAQPPLERYGERRTLTFAAPPDVGGGEVVLTGRLRAPDGSPLANHAVAVELVDPRSGESIAWGGEGRWRPFESDAEGRFTAVLVHPRALPAGVEVIVLDQGEVGAADDGVRAFVLLPLPARDSVPTETTNERRRSVDLGVRTLEAVPLLAAGVVVDPHGEPAAGTSVHLSCQCPEFESDGAIPAWWRQRVGSVGVDADRSGRFELRGFAGTTRCELRAFGRLGSQNVALEVGRVDHRIELERDESSPWPLLGTVAGRLLLDPEVPPEAIEVEIAATDPEPVTAEPPSSSITFHPAPRPDASRIDIGGRFARGDLRDGRWSVVVRLVTFGQAPTELARIEGIESRAGATTLVPSIDLRGRIRVARLTLVDADGDLVPAGHVFSRVRTPWPRSADETPLAKQPDHARFRDGSFVVCTATDGAPLEFLGLGCRRRIVRLEQGGEMRLELPRPLRLRFHLPLGIELPPPPLTLDVSLRTSEIMDGVWYLHGGAPPDGGGASFGPDGVAEVLLPAAANYSLGVTVSKRIVSGNSSGWSGYDVVRDQPFEVVDSDEPLEIELLEVTREAVEKAVRAMGGR